MEKDVVLVDVAPAPSPSAPMEIDGAPPPSQDPPSDAVDARTSDKEAIKVVKKVEFQLLCPQHNPVSATRSNLRASLFTGCLRSSC